MTLVDTRSLIAAAEAAGGAVPAFNVITLEHAEGIVEGLTRAGRPGLLQISENAVRFHAGRWEPLLAACRELAAQAAVPVAIHLDHVQDADLARGGIASSGRLGVTSIMVDAAHLADADNLRTTAELAALAHEAGLWVEAELGEIGGKGGAHTPGVRTDPDQAHDFVLGTGVDGLAVAVGSSHAMTSADAVLDLDLIARLAARVPVPLVLHGSSGVPPATMVAAVRAGIRKINIGTALNVAFTGQLRSHLEAEPRLTDPRPYLADAREAVATTVVGLCASVPER